MSESWVFTPAAPDAVAFKALYDSTGWGPLDRSAAFYAQALAGSWACCSAYRNGALVGFGRVISDGRLHAFITEMIVRPEAQGQGLGQQILRQLLDACAAAGITDIQLFAARGKSGFYERQGFVPRPADGPGMQYLPPWPVGSSAPASTRG